MISISLVISGLNEGAIQSTEVLFLFKVKPSLTKILWMTSLLTFKPRTNSNSEYFSDIAFSLKEGLPVSIYL